MPSTLLIHPSGAGVGATEVTGAVTDLVAATGGGRLPLRLDGLTRAGHWSATSLPSRLNREWAALCDSADNDQAVKDWAAPNHRRPGLAQLIGADGSTQPSSCCTGPRSVAATRSWWGCWNELRTGTGWPAG